MPAHLSDKRGATYQDHSTPAMRGSSDKSHVVIGPLTTEGLSKTEYWKNLGSNEERVELLKNLGVESAIDSKSEKKKIVLGTSLDTKKRFFILAERNSEDDTLKPTRLFAGSMTKEPEAGPVTELPQLLVTGRLSEGYAKREWNTGEIKITDTLKIPANGGIPKLPTERLSTPLLLNEANKGIHYNRVEKGGEVTLGKFGVDEMLKAHKSDDLVMRQDKLFDELIAQSHSQPAKDNVASTTNGHTPSHLPADLMPKLSGHTPA